MNQKLRLLIIFAAVSLCGLFFFGFVAYDTARNASQAKEQVFADEVAAHHLKILEIEVNERGSTEGITVELVNRDSTAVYVIAFGENGDVLSGPTDNLVVRDVVNNLSQNIRDDGRVNASGKVVDAGMVYYWYSRPVLSGRGHVGIVYSTRQDTANSFFRQMLIPLGFTIFIVLWLSSWCAMYVSSLISKLNEQKDNLQHSATHDALTKLPNRVLLRERLDQAINEAVQNETNFALCFIDLNRFKEINDTMGHHCGDELLVEVSKRLRDAMRGSDTVARLGGDEFGVIMKEVESDSVERVCHRLVQSIERAVTINGQNFFVSASIGISVFRKHGIDPQSLLRKADMAMYASKRSGNRITLYTDDLESPTRKADLSMASDLRESLDRNELKLFYQPKYDVNGHSIVGAEALVRWYHPSRGFVSPTEFVGLSEKTGLIKQLTTWVIDRAFFDHVITRQMGFDLTISVNLSILNLYDTEFIEEVSDAMERYAIEPKWFVFEITESAVMDNPEQAKIALDRLVELGFVVSVDDFGTGYSSFVNLKRLPIEEIKIDRSFVNSMINNEDDESIVRATIELGKSLGINVVAEGVENEKTLERVRKMGCQTVQGYLIGKPMSLDGLLQHIARINRESIVAKAAFGR